MSTPQIAYSMNESMDALRISRATIYKLIQQDLLKTYCIGRRRYATHAAILECQRKLESESAA